MILSLANPATAPDSSIATPSTPSLTETTLALIARSLSMSLRRCSVVVPAVTAIDLDAKSGKPMIVESAAHQEAAAVDEDQVAEVDVLHPRLRRSGVGALEVGLAAGDHRDAVGHRIDDPVDLEVRHADSPTDRRNYALAQVDRIAARLIVGLDVGEGQRIAGKGDGDRPCGLDFRQRVGRTFARSLRERRGWRRAVPAVSVSKGPPGQC